MFHLTYVTVSKQAINMLQDPALATKMQCFFCLQIIASANVFLVQCVRELLLVSNADSHIV